MMRTEVAISFYNPSSDLLNKLVMINGVIGLLACMALLFGLAKPRWKGWNVPTRLGCMALFACCFTGAFSSFEAAYLETYFRVPMVTVALTWAVIAGLWPLERRAFQKKRKHSGKE